MFDWIIEADIYRLEQALRDEPSAQKRHALEQALRHKHALLDEHRLASAEHG